MISVEKYILHFFSFDMLHIICDMNLTSYMSFDFSITILEKVRKNDKLNRKARGKYFIRKFNTLKQTTLKKLMGEVVVSI